MSNFASRWLTILGLSIGLSISLETVSWSQQDLTALEEEAVRAATERVAPCVVRVEALGGVEQYQGQLLGTGPTTGVIVSEDGYILSSAFGYVGKPSSIMVTLPSGKQTTARIVARDHTRMLVLLKVDAQETLPVPSIVPRDQLQVGQWSIAVGRTYSSSFPNMSVGILSAKDRIWGKAVQTDAKVSPSNYGGPLIDIRGNVMGILVPLSPNQRSELAGTQWYDSGIGFAVPLADIMPWLDTMKQGTDLKPGILGVSLKGSDMYSLPATIAACPAKSPAREAGLKVDDTIVEIDGRPIKRQAHLRHALGTRLAGETINVVVQRGKNKKRVEATVELVAELEPYVRPELGILPLRRVGNPSERPGVGIRRLIPKGPAATAGLQRNDRIVGLNDLEIPDSQTLRDALVQFEPGTEVTVKFARDDTSNSVAVELASRTPFVPDSLPPAHPDPPAVADEQPSLGVVDVEIPEVSNDCVAYVPQTYNPAVPYGLVVWLHAPGKFDQDKLINAWKPLCEQNDLILLAPQSAAEDRWNATEVDFIRKTMDHVTRRYSIDPARVAVHGHRAGGAMAYHVAFENRDICRAIAPVGAPLPARLGVPRTDPVKPLAIYSCSSADSDLAQRIKAGEEKLREKAFPVVEVTMPGPERYLKSEELARLVRWLDTLDRI
ncbi:MAG: PDZ domain-containing protein [Pirellulaceae bacterium]